MISSIKFGQPGKQLRGPILIKVVSAAHLELLNERVNLRCALIQDGREMDNAWAVSTNLSSHNAISCLRFKGKGLAGEVTLGRVVWAEFSNYVSGIPGTWERLSYGTHESPANPSFFNSGSPQSGATISWPTGDNSALAFNFSFPPMCLGDIISAATIIRHGEETEGYPLLFSVDLAFDQTEAGLFLADIVLQFSYQSVRFPVSLGLFGIGEGSTNFINYRLRKSQLQNLSRDICIVNSKRNERWKRWIDFCKEDDRNLVLTSISPYVCDHDPERMLHLMRARPELILWYHPEDKVSNFCEKLSARLPEEDKKRIIAKTPD